MITQYCSTSSPPPPSKMLTISTFELAISQKANISVSQYINMGEEEGPLWRGTNQNHLVVLREGLI